MFVKIKEFFQKPAVKVISWIVAGIGAVSLFLGGAGTADLNEFIELIEKIITVVGLIVAFITERAKK